MNPDDYKKVKEIFNSVLEIEPEGRAAFLDERCDGENGLRDEVERLLASCDSEFLETPAVAPFAEDVARGSSHSGQLIGHYSVITKIGSGGMGDVYLAEDGKLGRRVAIKILPNEFTNVPDRLSRFHLEARSASSLTHPNILTIHEIGEWEGTHYIATEYVDGETLRHRLHRDRLSVTEGLDYGVQLAAAIAAAHNAGITHRDLKPENIMIRRDRILKVLDFGLAKQWNSPVTAGRLATPNDEPTVRIVNTEPGVVMGTVQYMSPEQARGQAIDARSDIWSLGCVLYEMLTGEPPFKGESSADLIAEIVKTRPTSILKLNPDVPERFDEIISKSLEKDVQDRYQTSHDLLNDLKILKRKFDLSESLELSDPRITTDPDLGNATGPNLINTKSGPKDLTTVRGTEYFIWGIKAHRVLAVGIGLLIAALLGGTVYLVRNYWDGPNQARIDYANKFVLAAQALDASDLASTKQFLDETKPGPGEEDLRGFEWGYLSRLLSERLASQPLSLPHERPVESVAFSQNGMQLATGADNSIAIWDVETGQKLKTLTGQFGSVWSVEFSSDGKKLLSGSVDNTARLWDIETGEVRLILGSGGPARLWNIESGDARSTLAGEGPPVTNPVFSKDAKAIVGISGDSVKFWDAATGKEIGRSLKTDWGDRIIELSPDGRSLAVLRTADHSVVVIDIATHRQTAGLKGHAGFMTTAIKFSPDSRFILTGGTDGTAKLWELATERDIRTFRGHAGAIHDVAFSPQGKFIATGNNDHTIKVWDVATGREVYTLKGHQSGVHALAFSHDGQKLASVGGPNDNSAKIWNVSADESRGVLRGHTKNVRKVGFSPDGKTLVSTSEDSTTRIWSVDEERQMRVLSDTGKPVFSPDRRTLAIGGKVIKIWDLVTGSVRQSINIPTPADNLVYSPEGNILVSGHWGDWTVRLWDTMTGRELCSIPAGQRGRLYISTFKNGNGQRIVISSLDGNSIQEWEASTCRELSSFEGERDARYITSVASNGKIRALQVLNNFRSLKLIEIEKPGFRFSNERGGPLPQHDTTRKGTEIATFGGHESIIKDAQFSPEGNRLATSAEDGTIKIWDAATGLILLSIEPEAGEIESIAFSPKGDTLAAAASDGTVRLFRSDPLR